LNRTPLLILSAGIGAPSTAIVVEELVELGVTTIVRIGTCGALQHEIRAGDIIISTGCVREEGTTGQYVDYMFPAIPDHVVLHELTTSGTRQKTSLHIGITHCKDAYYLERSGKQLNPEKARLRWEEWRRAGVLVSEMETSVLFVLGSLRRIRTGAVFVNVGKITDSQLFENSLRSAVEIVKTAFSALIEKNQLLPATAPADDASYLDRPRGLSN
jgi:uridine phosphorylase